MNISHFTEPDLTVKSCLVYLNGIYPPKNSFYVEKDLNLPARLYPNAKIYIRCRCGEAEFKNLQFFKKLYPNRNIKLVPDNKIYDDAPVDVIWFIHYNFIFFGGKMDDYMVAKQIALQNFKGKIHILFNEEMTKTFEPLWDYVQHRNENFRNLNSGVISFLKEKKDWSNVTLIANEDKFGQWVNERPIERLRDTINISYLSDKILYDLPSAEKLQCTVGNQQENDHRGIYVAFFNPGRISCFKKHLNTSCLNLDIFGPKSNELQNYFGTGEPVSNVTAKELMSSPKYQYSIYIGKGSPSLYLGATFYEPILLGKPLFIWEGTDPDHKLFGNTNCYFKDDAHLKQMLGEYSTEGLKHLWETQVKLLKL